MTREPESYLPQHHLADLILSWVRDPGAATIEAKKMGLSRAELERLAAVFIAAGTQSLDANGTSSSWLAWRCKADGLDFHGGAHGRAFSQLVLRLEPVLNEWLKGPEVMNAFIMMKEPGFHFRVQTCQLARTEARIREWMEESGAAFEFQQHHYQAEAHKFGGVRGMEVAHRHFTLDTLACLEVYQRQVSSDAGGVNREFLSVLCVMGLLELISQDPTEAWDLWCYMRLTGRLSQPIVYPPAILRLAAPLRPLVLERTETVRSLGLAERSLVENYVAAHEPILRQLCELGASNELMFPVRQLIPFWVIYHWNRWGILPERQLALALGIEYLLNPMNES